ncbi:AbrB/MazE/SpoVT family DNA-binding domain-containing protein [Bacillus thuringiensis]|uniref:AbrB/MazE/SpoVT family DNA-binding domain-containing protein n=1 Tax=Bacillus thuringiensis TaxID=1428 RepID=UPI0011A68B00|nr:AbrB/MazE/SpoVT family DNA-binding domain-containing protein [Bacillus thuringiensis]
MKATGIVRKMDNLGRIVIPKETRRNLQVDSGDVLEIFVEEDAIILQKYQSYGTCPITGEISPQNIKQLMEELEQYKVTV